LTQTFLTLVVSKRTIAPLQLNTYLSFRGMEGPLRMERPYIRLSTENVYGPNQIQSIHPARRFRQIPRLAAARQLENIFITQIPQLRRILFLEQ
jgi:hypothetical protein